MILAIALKLNMMCYHGETIIAKGYKTRGIYILEGFNVVVHSSLTSENFHEKNKMWYLRSRHGGFFEVVSEHFMGFAKDI